VFDHTSVLKLIEWRWGLVPLTPRDASNDVQNLACTLNFSEPDPSVPSLPEPQAPLIAAPCLANLGSGILSTGSTTAPPTEWQVLGSQATALGFAVN
jgi:phospholipase C